MRFPTTKSDETPEFVAFWNLWRPNARHTDGRGDARDTFLRHVRAGADGVDILDGARCFLRTMKERDREYIPLAASWINKRAYEDLAEQERAYQDRIATRRAQQSVEPAPTIERTPQQKERVRQLVEGIKRHASAVEV